jgi:hypothetical protein
VRPKESSGPVEAKIPRGKYSRRMKTENEIQKSIFFIATLNKITIDSRRSPSSLPHFLLE